MTVYLLAGGGTAGHVNPLLAIAEGLREREPDATIIAVGTQEGLESRLVPERGFELVTIERLPFPRRPGAAMVRYPSRLNAAVTQLRRLLVDRHVDVVIGVGGYAAAPAYLAARRERVPFVVHEANSKPGLANRLGARWASEVGVAFDRTPIRGAVTVGMPLRREIVALDVAARRQEAREHFGLDVERPVLLVTGGSSGARSINTTVAEAAPRIAAEGWQVLHITGEYRDEVASHDVAGYLTLKYCDRMDLAFAASDLVICRSGTSTVAEVSALGIPAVFVPYPVGNGEQTLNAREAVEAGGAILVPDQQFTPEWIARDLLPLLGDPGRISTMGERIASVGRRDATQRVIDLIDAARGSSRPIST